MRSRSAFRCHLFHMHAANVFAQHEDFRAPNIRSIFTPLQQLSSPLLSRLCCAQIPLSERLHILLLLGEVMGASWNWNVLRGKPGKPTVMVSLASLLSWSGMACHCYF